MMKKLVYVIFGGALVLALVTGCGSSSKQNVDVKSTTKGQELQDLDEARKKGLITDKEYEKQKKEILKRK